MKRFVLAFALTVGLLTSASTLQAQVNMSRYITLTVKSGKAIGLDFKAAAAGTPVRIVSGSNTRNITVGTGWYNNNVPSTFTVTATASTMKIYGDITSFDCQQNGANLTALDLSHNTQLTGVNCFNNNLSILDVSHNTLFEWLVCSNNQLSNLDVSHNTQLTRLDCYKNRLSSLDVSKNTQLTKLYCYGNNFSTAALDDIFCALPDRTGKSYGKIQPIFNSSSSNHATVIATNKTNATAKNWKVQYYYDDTDIPATTGSYVCPAPEPNMNSYITLTVTNGAAIELDFRAALAGIPVRIVSGSNTQDITVGTSWYGTATYTAGSTSMTVYGDIIGFNCIENGANITALDPSHNTLLEVLLCQGNRLSNLDVSKNTKLKKLYCHGNNFSTAALDDIFCALPDRTGKGNGVIEPVYSDTSSNHAIVLATNKANAIAKNWKVQYYADDTDIPATTGTYVCGSAEPNMNSYITLTVAKDSAIKLDFRAAAAATPIRIVSGSNTQDITVGTGWTGTASYTAGSTTMTVYGDLTSFDCQKNGANLTALDLSHNTQLMGLNCGKNTLSSLDVTKNTQLTGLWCGENNLSSLDVSNNTQLMTLGCSNNRLSNLDISHNTQLTVLSCSNNRLSNLDVSKNTQLKTLYCHGNNFSTQALDDIFCALPDRTGKENGQIKPVYSDTSSNHAIVLATNKANATAKNWKVQYYNNNSDIPATSGTYVCPQLNMSRYITLTVAKDSAIKLDLAAAAAGTPVRIVSGSNTQDITVGTNWKGIATYTAGSTTMTIYGDLIGFDCSENGVNLTALDLSHNTQLTGLWCGENNLTSLDVRKNSQLKKLTCYNNKLSSLDVSKNTQLEKLYCWSNSFTTAALDDIYCALPDRTGKTNGNILPIYNSSSSDHATVLATNAQNAIDKNWKVQYYDNTDIPATTGKHKCSATTDIAEAAAEPVLTLYPNPVADVLYLSATARTVRIYNVYGIEVAHATDTDRVEVSHLPAGIYTVKADGTVAKMVKK